MEKTDDFLTGVSNYRIECNIDNHKWKGGHIEWTVGRIVWRLEYSIMTIANMIQKKKIATLRNFIEVRQMALNDPKFDLKNH